MTPFCRPAVDDLVHLLTDDDLPPRIVAVTGPRQSGKTTIVKQALRRVRADGLHGQCIALDDPLATSNRSDLPSAATTVPDPRLRTIDWLVGVWRRGRERAWEYGRGFVLALDEIQVVPGWSQAVKGLWDRDRDTGCPLKVIVLGSAPWSLLTGRAESLAGRFVPFDVRHWSLTETARAFDFDLDEYLFFGGYPGAAPFIRDLTAWQEVVDSHLSMVIELTRFAGRIPAI